MDYRLHTTLDGNIVFTSQLAESPYVRSRDLYKFIWVESGTVTLTVDYVETVINRGEVLTLSPLQHLEFKSIDGDYEALLFDSNFYCIYGHDSEVSCNGLLFNGSSHNIVLRLTSDEAATLKRISAELEDEYGRGDDFREEMLRIMLKWFIITCTRAARRELNVTPERERSFDIVRQFYVLVDMNFREKKQVRDYAQMLFRSPKTLSNLFAEYGLPSPLNVIRERTAAEAKRLLIYTSKSAKEIGDILGFDDIAAFSRFFKTVVGESLSDYRKNANRE